MLVAGMEWAGPGGTLSPGEALHGVFLRERKLGMAASGKYSGHAACAQTNQAAPLRRVLAATVPGCAWRARPALVPLFAGSPAGAILCVPRADTTKPQE